MKLPSLFKNLERESRHTERKQIFVAMERSSMKNRSKAEALSSMLKEKCSY